MVSVDIRNRIEQGKHPVGALIPDALRSNFKLLTGWDATSYLQQRTDGIDLFFEDTDHTFETTRAIYEAVRPLLNPGALCISHDALNCPGVIKGMVAAGFTPTIYAPDGTKNGLALCSPS
jgi:hypothetical protein